MDPQATSDAHVALNPTTMPAQKDGRWLKTIDRRNDPFFRLADTPMIPTEQGESQEDRPHEGQSFLMDLAMTPFNMIGFIISLFIIDQQQRQSQKKFSSSPSRYAEPRWRSDSTSHRQLADGTWKRESDSNSRFPDASEIFYTRKGAREAAKSEISDAFGMQRKVLFVILCACLLGLIASAYLLRRGFSWLFG